MTVTLQVPATHELKPKILVVGVGGAGCNAVSHMIASRLEGVGFVVADTDTQSLEQPFVRHHIPLGVIIAHGAERPCDLAVPYLCHIPLGVNITHGLPAGAHPDIGRQSAEEALENIRDHLTGSNMVFVACGMGGGTGAGAAPVVARAARDAGILTVGVATEPFDFEGRKRREIAEAGIAELNKAVDTLIVIPNRNLLRPATEKTTMTDAFKLADKALHWGVRSVTDLMTEPGAITRDLADVRAAMEGMGKATMGVGEAEGKQRAKDAADAAIADPLLDNALLEGARRVLVNIVVTSNSSCSTTLYEIDRALERIRERVGADDNIFLGSTCDDSLDGRLRVSMVAMGVETGTETDAGKENRI